MEDASPSTPTAAPDAAPTSPLSPHARTSEYNPLQPSYSDAELNALLSRLASKPSVSSVLVLSRPTGAVLRVEGALSVRDDPEKVKEYAGLVWGFVKTAGDVSGGLFGGGEEEGEGEKEEVKLLRMRTGRKEVVIVPDSRFILVVVHDVVSS